MTMPVLLVYGNCQAESLVAILRRTRAAEWFDVVYLRSYAHPLDGRATLEDNVLERCALVWEQRDYFDRFPYADRLPASCPVLLFPSMDLNVLWPWTVVNPYNRPEPPQYPFGRFPYGDRTVVEGLREHLPPDTILDRVLRVWEERPVKLDRLLQIERTRLEERDAECDVRMGKRLLQRFVDERSFFSRDHPTLGLLLELLHRLLERSCAFEPMLSLIDCGDHLHSLFGSEPLGEFVLPIHPEVARHFGMAWFDPDAGVGHAARLCDQRSYFEEMIRYGAAVRDSIGLLPIERVGAYHDGWAAREMRLRITPERSASAIVIRVRIPRGVPSETTLTIEVEGAPAAEARVVVGVNEIRLPMRFATGETTEISIMTSATVDQRRLGIGDDERDIGFFVEHVTAEHPLVGIGVDSCMQ